MKKLLLSSLAAAALSLASLSASAVTANSNFDVKVNLTSKCQTTTSPNPLMTFNYTAFATSDVPSNQISLAFKCTKGVAAPTASITAVPLTGNVLLGLAYTLTLSAATTGTLASAGPAAADTYTYTIDGNMVAGQAGDISSGVTASHLNRELLLSY